MKYSCCRLINIIRSKLDINLLDSVLGILEKSKKELKEIAEVEAKGVVLTSKAECSKAGEKLKIWLNLDNKY